MFGGLDVLCGPSGASGGREYRLLERLGAGAHADVYRGVAHPEGTEPLTIRVFRAIGPGQPDGGAPLGLTERIQAWHAGDQVLRALTERGVGHLCQWVDAFDGPPPRLAEAAPGAGALPFQVLRYIDGQTVTELLARSATRRMQGGDSLIDAMAVLRTVAATIQELHTPSAGLPVVHGDVQGSNVLVDSAGQVWLIDFTMARYETLPVTADGSGLPGDIYGFGLLACHLVTGQRPPGVAAETPTLHAPDAVAPWLREQGVTAGHPDLAQHLLALVTPHVHERPFATALGEWSNRLADLMATVPAAERIAAWPETSHPGPVLSVDVPSSPSPLRGVARVPAPAPPAAPPPVAGSWGSEPPVAPAGPRRPPLPEPVRVRGRGFVVLAVVWFAISWAIWLIADVINTRSVSSSGKTTLLGLVFCVVGAVGVYWLTRLASYVLRANLDRGPRRSTLWPNVTTSVFLFTCGLSFLSFTPLDPVRLIDIVTSSS